MGSRTQVRMQLMRQKVLDDEMSSSVSNKFSYFNNKSTLSYGSNCLPSLTSTLTSGGNTYDYCKPILDSKDDYHYGNENYQTLLLDPKLNHNPSLPPLNISNGYDNLSDQLPLTAYSNQHNHQYRELISHNNIDITTDSQMNFYETNALPLNNLETSYSCPVTAIDTQENRSSMDCQRRMSNSSYTGLQFNQNSVNDLLSPSSVVSSFATTSVEDKRNQLKDRNKKESHNRIERKRRDFINQQIIELSNLIPSNMLAESDSKKNKGNILKNSVDYIQYLQNELKNYSKYMHEAEVAFKLIEYYRRRIQELEERLPINNGSNSNINNNNCSSSNSDICNQMSPNNQNAVESYNNYILLRENNQRAMGCSTTRPMVGGTITTTLKAPKSNYQPSVEQSHIYITQQQSQMQPIFYQHQPPAQQQIYQNQQHLSPSSVTQTTSNFMMKIEPSSAHSSLGKNSIPTGNGNDSILPDLSPYSASNQSLPLPPSQHQTSYSPCERYSFNGFSSAPLPYDIMEC